MCPNIWTRVLASYYDNLNLHRPGHPTSWELRLRILMLTGWFSQARLSAAYSSSRNLGVGCILYGRDSMQMEDLQMTFLFKSLYTCKATDDENISRNWRSREKTGLDYTHFRLCLICDVWSSCTLLSLLVGVYRGCFIVEDIRVGSYKVTRTQSPGIARYLKSGGYPAH